MHREIQLFTGCAFEQLAQAQPDFLGIGDLDDFCIGLVEQFPLQRWLQLIDGFEDGLSENLGSVAADSRSVLADKVIVVERSSRYS